MMKLIDGKRIARPPFAPPFLKAGKLVIGQTANILFYLGARLGLAPRDEAGRLWVHQLQLTITDLVVLIHDTHHPITGYLYFEQQRAAAKLATKYFWRYRLPKFLRYFERVLEKSGGPYLLGRRLTYADLSLFQIVEGLRYAFPKRMKRFERKLPRIDRAARPRRQAPAHRRLSRLGPSHSVQPVGHLPLFQGARRVACIAGGACRRGSHDRRGTIRSQRWGGRDAFWCLQLRFRDRRCSRRSGRSAPAAPASCRPSSAR